MAKITQGASHVWGQEKAGKMAIHHLEIHPAENGAVVTHVYAEQCVRVVA